MRVLTPQRNGAPVPDAHWLWESATLAGRVARGVVLPAAGLFRCASGVRNAAFDRGVARAHPLGAPAVSVGNLTVGGTGKTPVANWLAGELAAAGARPAILLRGYGGDEAQVHAALHPGLVVVADRDRVRGARSALARGGDVLVLDDAFQHRRAARDADLVLLSAETPFRPRWPLPAGPWREPLAALRRATAVIVTRKAAADDAVEVWAAAAAEAAPGTPVVVVRLELGDLVDAHSGVRSGLATLAGRGALVISAIGRPSALEAQLAATGIVVHARRFPDHHPFSRPEAESLARAAQARGVAVCTLKDAVKLRALWPREAPPLWYVSQRVIVERRGDVLTRVVSSLVGTRAPAPPQPSA